MVLDASPAVRGGRDERAVAVERTLIIVKPDGVQRGLVGEIVTRFERRGFKIAGLKLMWIDRSLAERHYAEHKGKGFFEGLVGYMTSAPVVVGAIEGPNAISVVRQMGGATKPADAPGGTIRGDFGLDIGRNVIHTSEGPEAAAREIGLFFQPAELLDYPRANDPWVLEAAWEAGSAS